MPLNANTKASLTAILGLINPALAIVGGFATNSKKFDKLTGDVEEAIGVVTALVPLLGRVGDGESVTLEDMRLSLAGKDAALAQFDEIIAQKGG